MTGKRKSFKVLILSLIAALLIFIPAMAAPQTAEAALSVVRKTTSATGGAKATVGVNSTKEDNLVSVKIKPEYRQSMARNMLPLINNWRAGLTWYYNNSNKKVFLNNLKPLTYDYTLEKYAMQRAAELIIHFDHMRPRGDVKTGISGYTAFGENMVTTMEKEGGQPAYAFEIFKAEDKPYSGQVQRKLMLSVPGDFSNIGISCVYYNGAYYWCQVYGVGSKPNTTPTIAVNGSCEMTVEIDKSLITTKTPDLVKVNYWEAILERGKSCDLPEIDLNIATAKTKGFKTVSVQAIPTWTSSNSNVVYVDSKKGTITGVSAGMATVTMKEPITGTTKSKAVTVTDPNAVTGVRLDKTTLNLNVGASSTLKANVLPGTAPNKNVTWSSSNTAVATVSNTGVVKGVSDGTATITVKTVSGGKTATCKVTVTDPNYTGLKYNKADDTWYYYSNGKKDTKYVGVSRSTAEPKGKFPVKNGKWDKTYTGLAYSKTDDTWYYFTNGRYDTKYVGTSSSTAVPDGKFPVKNGKWDKTYTGLAYSTTDATWYYFTNGRYDTKFEGTAPSTKVPDGKFMVKGGKWDKACAGVAYSKSDNKWLYFVNGKVDISFTGVAKSTKGNWVFVRKGVYDASFTGVAKSTKNNWIYVKAGRYNTSFTGVATVVNTSKKYYMVKGRWDNKFNGKYQNYTIKNGVVV